MSSRGFFWRSVSVAPTYSMSLTMAAAEMSLYMPFSGSRWKDSSIQPRTMSRSSGGTPSSAAIT